MSLRRTGCLAVLVVVSFLSFTVKNAECITVKPAAFDHIVADLPEEVMAGVEFEISVTFVDKFGNPMERTWRPESSLVLQVSQPASVKPSVLTPENYVPGFKYRVHTEKMGKLTLSLRDEKGKVLEQWDLTIKSGRPAMLLVDLPSRAEVGETVKVSIQAVDSHGNVAFGYSPEARTLVFEDGSASFAGEVQMKPGGIYEIPVKFKSKGRQSVTIRDRKAGLTGSSAAVSVAPAPLDAFEIESTTDRAGAGQELALTIRAMDRYGNPVADYSDRYKGVRLYSGTADISPDLVSPGSFSDGVARIGITIRKAGNHIIKISELQSNISGETGVDIQPGAIEKVEVRTPESATAGEPFILTLTSFDEFGNRTPTLPSGAVIRLQSTGTGTLKPGTVPGSAFKDGIARVKVSYEVAESFEITANVESAGKAADLGKTVDKKEKKQLMAEKARERAVRARRESRLREKQVTGTTVKKAVGKETAAARKKKPDVVKKKVATPPPAKTVKSTRAPDKVKTAVKKSPAVSNRKILRPGVLNEIAVVEDDEKALVTFSTNGMTNYNVTTSAKLSRKWIDIEFPDITTDLPDRIKGGEKIIGEVYVIPSDEKGSGARISIEILPTRIGYDVYQERQSIVLKVSKQ